MAEVKKGWTPPVPVLVLLAGLVVVTLLFEWLLFLSARQQAQAAPSATVHGAAPKALVTAEPEKPKATTPNKTKPIKPAAAPEKPKPEPNKEERVRCSIHLAGSPDVQFPAFPTDEEQGEFGKAPAQGLSDTDMVREVAAKDGTVD